MAWYSILPPQLIQFESWAVRIFFLLGLITIAPWAALVVFDAGLYLYRMILWELPWIGGRARGHQRPRAPSLQGRPDGQRRVFGLRDIETESGDGDSGRSEHASSSKTTEGDSDAGKDDLVPGADGGVKRRVAGRA